MCERNVTRFASVDSSMPYRILRTLSRYSRVALLAGSLAVVPCFVAPVYSQIPGDGDESRWTKNEFEAQLRLAQVYEENRDFGNAVRLYERLYKERPEILEAFEGYARTLEAMKKFAEAEAVIEK